MSRFSNATNDICANDASNVALSVQDLHISFDTPDGVVVAVNGLSFDLMRGTSLGIVGESGSGKSQTVLALLGLQASNGRVTGKALYHGEELLAMPAPRLNCIRGNRIAMIFQDPMTALNPYLRVSRQMTEVLMHHRRMSMTQARECAIAALTAVHITDAARRIDMYPHEFSGGMRQRVMIAMALLCEPDILIADEPTTALDVTVQAEILGVLRQYQQRTGMSIIFITHDLGVVAELCDDVVVMYAGRMIERADVFTLFESPAHPYSAALLAAVPHLEGKKGQLFSIPGQPPDLTHMPPGCAFVARCTHARACCHSDVPLLTRHRDSWSACHFPIPERTVLSQ